MTDTQPDTQTSPTADMIAASISAAPTGGRAQPLLRHRCGALKDAWYAAARSDELRKGQPLQRVIMEELIALWRRPDGAPAALVDRCPHRNALLSEGDIQPDGAIRCPYHGWTFGADGACLKIPSESEDGCTSHRRSTEPFPVCERDGLIWIWMGGPDRPPLPDEQPFSMPHWGEDGWRTYYMTTRFENDVTNLVENFMDVPHTVFVHRGWFRTRKAMQVQVEVERRADSVHVTYEQQDDSIGVSTLILNPKRLPMTHTDRFFMPNNTRVDYLFGGGERGFVITSTCTPIHDSLTEVYTLISYKLGWFGEVARWVLPWYTRQVIQQDVDIMAIQRRALAHYGEQRFSSTPADTIHLYIESLRRWAAGGRQGPPPRGITKNISFWI